MLMPSLMRDPESSRRCSWMCVTGCSNRVDGWLWLLCAVAVARQVAEMELKTLGARGSVDAGWTATLNVTRVTAGHDHKLEIQ